LLASFHFVMQSSGMEANQVTEHLQVIRTLMERSALYRRALAPVMLFVGLLGLAATVAGIALHLDTLPVFGGLWLGTACLALAGAFVIARRQALKEREPFWSPPTRRVAQALLPPLTAGLLFSIIVMVFNPGHTRWLFIFPNILFYGCAVHAAGFFMPRGMKWFAWLIIVLGSATLLAFPLVLTDPNPTRDHLLMGFFFGALHLAYGAYLYLTEKGKNAA
jgi:hypothetical protein